MAEETTRFLTWTLRRDSGNTKDMWDSDSKDGDNFEIHEVDGTGIASLWEGGDWHGDFPGAEVAKEVAEFLVRHRI